MTFRITGEDSHHQLPSERVTGTGAGAGRGAGVAPSTTSKPSFDDAAPAGLSTTWVGCASVTVVPAALPVAMRPTKPIPADTLAAAASTRPGDGPSFLLADDRRAGPVLSVLCSVIVVLLILLVVVVLVVLVVLVVVILLVAVVLLVVAVGGG